MQVVFTESERVLLRQAQYACRGKAGYVPITVLLMRDYGRSAAAIAQDLDLDESTVHRYAQACQHQGLAALLAQQAPGYAGRLNSTQLPKLRADKALRDEYGKPIAWLLVDQILGQAQPDKGVGVVVDRGLAKAQGFSDSPHRPACIQHEHDLTLT